ncbi:MAG: DedA family protein [Zoogloeaceae bacterium]|nr:DedA family protein [Zoogloeaceae bacterium]
MEFFPWLFDLVLHLDQHLADLAAAYGGWVYPVLFLIVFAETGFVVTPFLPGDSLLFAAGALAALPVAPGENAGQSLDFWLLTGTLSAAAILGNTINYQIGRFLGPRVFQWPNSRFFNRSALEKTQAFYVRHGGKTIALSRFLPLLRTFAPFVAGIGRMAYGRFVFFNVCGALAWVFLLCALGYWFGNLEWVRRNLALLMLLIVVVSLLPIMAAFLRRGKTAPPD